MILVIDDDDLVLGTLELALARAGHKSVTAKNGREGIELFRRHRPVLVITDIVMPEAEGIETIRHLRKFDPAPLIIAISGSDHYLHAAQRFGASAVLQKPFRTFELFAVIHRLLERD